MKSKLFTRNRVLGFLMMLVMVFGVQGIVDALTLTATSPIVESKREGSTFEISFTVGLTAPTTAYDDQSPRRRVTDHNTIPATPPTSYAASTDDTDAARIDSSGYQVQYIGSTAYRYTAAQAEGAMMPTGGTSRALSLTSSGVSADDNPPTSPYYVDTSGNVVDSSARAVYIRTGASGSYSYARAKADPYPAVDSKYRSDYNEEMISITSDTATITITNKRDGQEVVSATGTTGEMDENSPFGKLRSSVTLVCKPSTAGTYVITIADTTPPIDVPRLALGKTPAPITFTLHVTPATTPATGNDNILPDIQRRPVDDDVVPVSGYLAFESQAGTDNTNLNRRIRYEVVRGSGTLYVGTLENEYTTPSALLSVHQASNVYLNTNGSSNEVHVWFAGEDRSAPRATIVYEYKGKDLPARSGGSGDTVLPPLTTRGSLNISASGSGNTRTVTVVAVNAAGIAAPGIGVQLTTTGGTLSATSGITPLTSTLTLPATAGTYTLTATTAVPNYDGDTESVTVTLPGTLSLEELGARATNGGQSIRVTVREVDGSLATGNVTVTLSGVVNRTVPTTNGIGSAAVVLPTTGGTVTLRATGYNDGSYVFPAAGQQQQQQQQQQPGDDPQPTTTRGTAGVADSIQIRSDAFPSGAVNAQLAQPLTVRVLDANGVGVANAKVTFRVTSGQGRLSQRGNGRAIPAVTDARGDARAEYTPLGASSTVRVTASKVTQTVTFTITANGGSETGTEIGTDPGSGEPAETPSREIRPEVLLGAAQRPPMAWVDSGGIYALVGASVGRFTTGSGAVMGIAVSGTKIYWTAQTGEKSGTINAANLDGTGAKQLVSIKAVPRGIAVDPVAKRLYWTNSQGWIQSSNLEGTARRNVVSGGLENPMRIAVGNGSVYWTDGDGGLRAVNLTGTKTVRNISTGTDATDGVVVFGGKIYWTEMTGENSGTINSVNLDGAPDPKRLVSIRAVPRGIAVDPVAKRLYWTNSHGWIQSSDLEGRARRNVANELGNPGGIVVSANIKAPAAATPTKSATSTTASKSKYDINGDGTVDSTDVDALLLAVLAELTDAKYDVNGDGAVDAKDVREVNKNLGAGAAGAPRLLGMKFSALEVDRLQEQIDLLIATNDQSPAAMRTLVYLQQLIAMARPDQTQLLANYPNPFNPETWMPYELATDTDVRITIYNAQGAVIRTLQLGQQSAGYYTDRERAAYWDGRNAFGEQVASGVYFYQLETDTMSALRKMVILK